MYVCVYACVCVCVCLCVCVCVCVQGIVNPVKATKHTDFGRGFNVVRVTLRGGERCSVMASSCELQRSHSVPLTSGAGVGPAGAGGGRGGG